MSRSKDKDSDSEKPAVIVEYVINAPKKAVYQAWMKHIWEENAPFKIGVSSLGSTSDNIGSAYKYNQRKLLLSTITETMIKLKPNNYVCYKVESLLMLVIFKRKVKMLTSTVVYSSLTITSKNKQKIKKAKKTTKP